MGKLSRGFSPGGRAVRAADQLHSAAIHLLRHLRREDPKTGVGPAQLSALSVLVFAGPQTLGALAAAEQVKPPTMSRIVSALHRARLVRRESSSKDRRLVRLRATAKGIRLLQRGRRRRIHALARLLRRLPPRDVARLEEAARILERALHR